jgi:hypothetical protein
MGAGELTLTGGADRLMEGEFSYNVSDWKPEVSYDASGEEGEFAVKQGGASGAGPSGEARNEWDISINDELPTDLVVRLGAGESELDLDSLTLTGLDLRMGSGKSTVDLTGDYARDFDASIEGGVGEATELLPSEVGVEAKAEGGIGGIDAKGLEKVGDSYVNDAYGESDTNVSVEIKGGVGAITLKVVWGSSWDNSPNLVERPSGSSQTGRIARLLVARNAKKGALSPRSAVSWSPFGVSRRSLEVRFSEVRLNRSSTKSV